MSDPLVLALDGLAPDVAIGSTSRGILAIPHLAAFFDGRPIERCVPSSAGVIGWGRRPSGERARAFAARRGVPFALIEDGFLRSVGLGKTGAATVSLVADDRGVYYDAAAPSRLEAILASDGWTGSDVLATAARLRERWVRERLSKYNLGRDDWTGPAERLILVDQVAGDASVPGAGADAATFRRMVVEALRERPASGIVARIHPDVAAGKAKGYLAPLIREFGLSVISDDLSPPALLDGAAEVWTVSSALGFEALLRGIPVVSFGMPFYAGWSLTSDRAEGPVASTARSRRGRPRDRDEMFAAALMLYARYADPVTRRRVDLGVAMDRICDWRARHRESGGHRTIAFGFAGWKQRQGRVFLGGADGEVEYRALPARMRVVRSAEGDDRARFAVWGMRDSAGFEAAVRATGVPLLRVEDGFLRSVGLGSDRLPPGSLVLDDLGLYYDARRPSRLERIIEEGNVRADVLARADALRTLLVARALSKYNLGRPDVDLRAAAGSRRVALVVEQVPHDASIRLGGGDHVNLALLAAVRADRPDAFVVYKEHPDLVSGNRWGRTARRRLARHADLVLSSGDLASVYAQVDELHVVSSLAGFEGLLRGVDVHVWGRPFYAGWGLTSDRLPIPRRTRRATLTELVAATLILYPRYADPITGVPCSVEDFLAGLDAIRAAGPVAKPFWPLALLRRIGW
jgi:capsular polysaccharide export protein